MDVRDADHASFIFLLTDAGRSFGIDAFTARAWIERRAAAAASLGWSGWLV